jgi:hypothetical protein
MTHYTIQIEVNGHLQQTPITPEDIEEILSLLGYSKPEIATAQIQVSQSHATVHWTVTTVQVAAQIHTSRERYVHPLQVPNRHL